MKKNKLRLITITVLIALVITPLGISEAVVSDFQSQSDPMVLCTYSNSWVSNPGSHQLAEGVTATFELVLTPTSMCGMSFTITSESDGFTFSSIATSSVSPHEERRINIGIKMPEKSYESQQYKTFKLKINPSSGNSRTVQFQIYFTDSCGDFITGWTKNPSNYSVKEGERATFEFIIKNRCDDENMEVTLSTNTYYPAFSNKKFNVLAGKQFKVDVQVMMPETRRGKRPEKHTWNFEVKSDSGVTKRITFSVNYDY